MNFRDDKEILMYTTKEGESSSSTRQWSSRLKNPRIVRMSRTFGGKDRHSKVCTIKGLRDRRIRLSVPTAIQLYDLQDRLGLNQPSKVIDWLLDVTKHDIDELPPLPGIPGCFGPFQQALHTAQGYGMSLSSSDLFFDANMVPSRRSDGLNINSNLNMDVNEDLSIEAKLRYWDSRRKKNEDDQVARIRESDTRNSQVLAQNLFPITSDGSNASVILPQNPSTLLRNHTMHDYNNLFLEPSNLSLTQIGNHGGLSSYYDHHHQGNHSGNSSSLPSSLASSMATSSLIPQQASYNNHLQFENDIRQLNRFTLSNNHFPSSMYTSTSLGLKPFPLSMSNHLSHFHQSDAHREDKDNDDSPWK